MTSHADLHQRVQLQQEQCVALQQQLQPNPAGASQLQHAHSAKKVAQTTPWPPSNELSSLAIHSDTDSELDVSGMDVDEIAKAESSSDVEAAVVVVTQAKRRLAQRHEKLRLKNKKNGRNH